MSHLYFQILLEMLEINLEWCNTLMVMPQEMAFGTHYVRNAGEILLV